MEKQVKNDVPATTQGNENKDLVKTGIILGASAAAGAAGVMAVVDGLVRFGGWIIRKTRDGVAKHQEKRAAKKAAKEEKGGSK